MRSLAANLMVLGGAGVAVYGCWLWAPWLGYVVGGAASCAAGVLVADPKKGTREQ